MVATKWVIGAALAATCLPGAAAFTVRDWRRECPSRHAAGAGVGVCSGVLTSDRARSACFALRSCPPPPALAAVARDCRACGGTDRWQSISSGQAADEIHPRV